MKFAILALAFLGAVMAQGGPKVPAKGDFRNEFDHLLVSTLMEGMYKGEQHLLRLSEEIAHLESTKTKVEQDRIVREIEVTVAFIEGGARVVEQELKRTDLNILERFNFEEVQALSKLLVKDLKEAEVKVKAVKTH
ncbi:PREDICTED: mite allergen Blo t 5-like [Rhagoletis zephyria]|uniref:mite allergen Blo t 5-like n=1 Tax=Rhagoletis zephyria TaxID=28612 RepID=UPI0008117205|nr:PREDICTED: mite allergen Blo t 5-like [Rhagoletis zephyria]KAH9405890.1 hypothetical protein TYRP_014187 [Tyrophagus putrescentiae]WCD24727.1 Tyr p 5 allergen [Tyrophagus putrescentiae]